MNFFEKEQFLARADQMLEQASAEEVIAWAVNQYPKITLACSFGAEDVVLVDMLQQISPAKDIFYLDTDFHFKETYETRDRLAHHYGIEFIQVKSAYTPEAQAEAYGDELWKRDPDQCCQLRKIEPLTRLLKGYDAWMTGIRREQAPTRANAAKVAYDLKFDLVKINPLASWTNEEVWTYIREHQLIYNPLHDNHYPSIGCTYCTKQVAPGEDPRSGRWAGQEKTECGLHQHHK